MIFDVSGQAFQKFPKQQIYNAFNISKKIWEMKMIFCIHKHQSSLQVDFFNTLGIKVSYKVILS